jgi:hypothetical protein
LRGTPAGLRRRHPRFAELFDPDAPGPLVSASGLIAVEPFESTTPRTMRTLLDWTSGHWGAVVVIAAAIVIALLALQAVVWILSHSD